MTLLSLHFLSTVVLHVSSTQLVVNTHLSTIDQCIACAVTPEKKNMIALCTSFTDLAQKFSAQLPNEASKSGHRGAGVRISRIVYCESKLCELALALVCLDSFRS
jgi:hypothetical protein